MGDIEPTKVLENNWVSITFFANGIISPIFFATGMAILCNEKREQKFKSLSIKAQQIVKLSNFELEDMIKRYKTFVDTM